MNLFLILVFVQILICLALGGLILIQRSEGGALGMGGGPSGFMSARGAGNLLTRLTAIFAVLFFANSIGLTVVGNLTGKQTSVADKVDASKLPAGTPLLPSTGTASSAASVSTPAAPSLNDLPLAGTAAPAASSASSSSSSHAKSSTAASAAQNYDLSMPTTTTTGKIELGKSGSSSAGPTLKLTPKPAPKPASSASSAVHSNSAAPSSSAPVAPSSSASTTPSTPASSQ
jgi:preprotein translocase subunit SecG